MSLRPVILCGGAGTRLWPLSRSDRPKPLLALEGEDSLLRTTIDRTAPLAEPWLLCGSAHEEAIGLAAPGLRRLVEPAPRGTAPAAAAAALLALRDDPDAVLLLVPADHAVAPVEAFHASVARAVRLAADGLVVTFGVPPRGASEQFGWIEPGDALGEGNAVARFVEKPPLAEARALLESGCLWNAGVVVCRADRLVAEVEAADAELLAQVRAAVDGSTTEGDRVLLGPDFARARAVSFDVLVLQRTRRAAVVPASFRWADLGTWPAVIEARGGRSGGMVLADGMDVQVLGDPDVLVAVTGGSVLVAAPSHAGEVAALPVRNPAVVDRGPGWRVERRFVVSGDVFDGIGTGVLLAGRATARGALLGCGSVLPPGAVAASAGTWLVVHPEPAPKP
jgi:mannose-1-phosphate guanylyltransferase/mannose-6-phosphate isomerase